MSEFVQSIRDDLSSKPMLALLAVLCAAVVAAVAYAALGGSGGEGAKVAGNSAGSTQVAIPPVLGPAVSNAPANPDAAVAETPGGVELQHHGPLRNPFEQPQSEQEGSGSATATGSGPGPIEVEGGSVGEGGSAGTGGEGESGSSTAGSSGGEAGSGGEGGSATGQTGGTGPEAGSESENENGNGNGAEGPSFEVTAKLVRVSPEGKQLGEPRVFKELTSGKVFPSSKKPLLDFLGIGKANGGAVFMLVKPAIVRGQGVCLPKPSNCEGVELGEHQSEQLQYLLDGAVVVYRLKVVKLKVPASAAAAGNAKSGKAHANGGKAHAKGAAKRASESAAGKGTRAHAHTRRQPRLQVEPELLRLVSAG